MFYVWMFIILWIINKTSGLSYNRPKFCSNATWNPNAITFANRSTIGREPWGIFINSNNTVYAAARTLNNVQMWFEGNLSPITLNFSNLSGPTSLFATTTGDIYVANDNEVDKLILNDRKSIPVMNENSCMSIFVDINDNLYCSLPSYHQVVKKSLNSTTNTIIIVAGNGTAGSLSNMLNSPYGIFVDINFDLYVADYGNNRIQFFKSGQLNGTTLVGNGSAENISLSTPRGIVLDADKNIYIAEHVGHRVVVSGSNGFRCLFGCSGSPGSASNELSWPTALSFDSYGNIFVMDAVSHRIQKFVLLTKLCDCSSTKMKLISKGGNEYKFDEEIHIYPEIELYCQELFLTKSEWTISNLNQSNSTIEIRSNELFLPSKYLKFGFYEIKLKIILISSINLTLIESINIQIIPTNKIIVNLIQSEISKITIGENQELFIEPSKYSFHQDGSQFIENNWNFEYYCRIYDLSNIFLPINESTCFSNQSNKIFYSLNIENQIKSSLKIFPNSFQSNKTYELMVTIKNRQNPSLINRDGYLMIYVQKTFSHRILISCLISAMCFTKLINPTTQIFLKSDCLDNCSSHHNIHWNIYQKAILNEWIPFNQTTIETFGQNTNSFTISKELFVKNPTINDWQIEVIYEFFEGNSSSSVYFEKNFPPLNGKCSIFPKNGTTKTLFEILCSNWVDKDEIKDYSIYVWTNDYSKREMIGFSLLPRFKVYLPNGNLNIKIDIRDKLNSIQELNISSVYVENDLKQIENFIENFQNSKINLTNNLLLTENQNQIGQILNLISQQFNQINQEKLNYLISNNISTSQIFISTLDNQYYSQSNLIRSNQTLLDEYMKEINLYGNIREYLINLTRNFSIIGSKNLIFQSLILIKLTEQTNQLTRLTSKIASEKCYELSLILNETSQEISFEDIQTATTLLFQCTSHILNAINGPLQERMNILHIDLIRSNQSKEFTNEITKQINETISLLTLALKNHLNLGQNFQINTSQLFLSFEATNQFSNKQIRNAEIKFPSNFSSNEKIFFRTKLESLAPFGNSQSNTNYSRSLSLSILNENGIEFKMKTNELIELIIPRDPNIILPEMILQNVVDYNQSFYYKFIDLNKLKPNENLTISIHFQIQPLNQSLAYLFIYKFDQFNQLYDSILFCPSNLTDENLYTFYLDNQQTSKHQSIIYGLRELTSIEFQDICLNNFNEKFSIENLNSIFTSNYRIRIYTSGCYHLDQFNNWQSDGLLVGSKTNLYQTQCFTNHF